MVIACALSGGVDSAVSLYLLLKRLPRRLVKAVFMTNWNEGGDTTCPLSDDLKSVRAVAEHLDVELHTVDFSKDYWLHVFEPMVDDYRNGLTPNPDVLCNRHIKFDRLLEFCQTRLGAERLATGHYARICCDSRSAADGGGGGGGGHGRGRGLHLLRGLDRRKDQTFFLAGIRREALAFAEFPVGHLPKRAVKQIAVEMGLPELARRKESTGICFIGKRNFREFIDEYVERRPGNFVDIDTGKVVGQHQGRHQWTLGQRAHIWSSGRPYFVARFTAGEDILVCQGNSHPSLFCDMFVTRSGHWLNESYRGWSGALGFKTQHIDPVMQCRVEPIAVELTSDSDSDIGVDGGGGPPLRVRLGHFKRAVAPGQYVVFYDGDECVGSAKIDRLGPTLDTILGPSSEATQRRSREETAN